jgi:hypothetical protein
MRIRTLLVPVLALSFAVVGCDVDQTEEGNMPDVDVEGGNLPEYDVQGPDVTVGQDTSVIITPKVDVKPPQG